MTSPRRTRKCPVCRKGVQLPANISYTTEMKHDGQGYSISVPLLAVLKCDNLECEAITLPDASQEVLDMALREKAHLLTPAQITAGRQQLRLSQKDFAELLGVAPETISRWESGAQIQQRVMNELICSFYDVPELRHYLSKRRGIPVVQPELPVTV